MSVVTRVVVEALDAPPPTRVRVAPGHDEAVAAIDEAAFAAFYRAHCARVIRTVTLIVHDQARAEDIAQDAFIQLMRNWSRVAAYERPEAWVRRVAIRLAVRGLRRDALWTAVRELFLPREAPAGQHLEVSEAIRQLPRSQRAAIVLHYYEDRPVAEIAALLGCSEPTARVHLFRGRKRLAALLGEDDDAA